MASWKYDQNQQHHGMDPVGYDADTQVYTYRDAQGNYYDTDEGSGRYGNLRQTYTATSTARQSGFNGEGVPAEVVANDWKMMKPFVLLITVVLLALLWYVNFGGSAPEWICQPGFEKYAIAKGDTCWGLAVARKTTVDGLIKANEGLECEKLQVGGFICIPELVKK